MASSMEVQSKDVSETVLASSGSSGSVSVALHPLVIMNISEHYTRIKAQYGNTNPQGKYVCLKSRKIGFKRDRASFCFVFWILITHSIM